ncbi:MAG: tRNA uridine-5-carboxymethylaminomethyl(34) synthesis GTPase MnmE [Ignavibacteriota bacterium]
MSLITLHDTICALSTPPGKSAIAVLRLAGSDAIKICANIISHPEKLFATRGGNSLYTNIIDAEQNHIDDVIIVVFRAPNSYTGEDLVEIHTHGSTLIIELVQNLLRSSGARLAEAGEFSRRAYMHGKISLPQLDLLTLRIGASSEQMLSRAEALVAKKFDRLTAIYDSLIGLLAQINAQIDFGESDLVEISNFTLTLKSIRDSLEQLLEQASNISANKGYYSVALIGEPNVGKSSLFNALLKYERSIVSNIPGTTRDYLEAFVIIEGFRIKLIDTAGLRDANEELESKGISLGRTASEQADLTLRLTGPESRDTVALADEALVHNKSDLDNFSHPLSFSATSGAGLPSLLKFLHSKLLAFDSQYSNYSISDSERSLISEVLRTLAKVLPSGDITLIAEDLKHSLEIVGSLLGNNVGEDSLNHIFMKMCIGK